MPLRDTIYQLRQSFLQSQSTASSKEIVKEELKEYQIEFIRFAVARNALKFGLFTLKSGRESPYFFNAGLFSSGPSMSAVCRFLSTIWLVYFMCIPIDM